jgi:hypothetical protein
MAREHQSVNCQEFTLQIALIHNPKVRVNWSVEPYFTVATAKAWQQLDIKSVGHIRDHQTATPHFQTYAEYNGRPGHRILNPDALTVANVCSIRSSFSDNFSSV